MNRLFSLILIALLSLPISVLAVDNTASEQPLEAEKTVVENTLDEDIETSDMEFKEPIGTKKIAKKFLMAMGGVAVSSFLLFFMLTFYNRVREKVVNKVKTPDGETTLETPNDLDGAIKTFLEKTKW